MPRLPRAVIPGVPLHVIQRGNNRVRTFHSAEDFEEYRQLIREASQRFRCSIHAYVLMSNHVHLLTTPDDEKGPSRMMQFIGQHYVPYVNKRYARTGTLWEGRFRSSLVDSERYLLACSRYIELNPVRAGMITEPDQYYWSSYRCNAYGEVDALVTPHWVYERLAFGASERLVAYRALFRSLSELATLDEIRSAVQCGGVLGDDRFRAQIETRLGRRVAQPRSSRALTAPRSVPATP